MSISGAVDDVVKRVIDAYTLRGGMSFCYGQGSVLTNLTQDSDIDVVMIWDRVAPRSDRPAGLLSDDGAEPVQFDGPFGGLDNLRVDGWPVDVAHHTISTFEHWKRAALRGDGWQEQAWPLPLYAISGFVYGVDLSDPAGEGDRARSQLLEFPYALLEKARLELEQTWSGVQTELAGCVLRSDGWLFHELAGPVIRTTYIAWFAAHQRYCPFPKRIAGWAERFGLEPEILEHEQRLWATPSLDDRLSVLTALVEGVLQTCKAAP